VFGFSYLWSIADMELLFSLVQKLGRVGCYVYGEVRRNRLHISISPLSLS